MTLRITLIFLLATTALSAQVYDLRMEFSAALSSRGIHPRLGQWAGLQYGTFTGTVMLEREWNETWTAEGGLGLNFYSVEGLNPFNDLFDFANPLLMVRVGYNFYHYPTEAGFVRLGIGTELADRYANVGDLYRFVEVPGIGQRLFGFVRPEVGFRGHNDLSSFEVGLFYRWNEKWTGRLTAPISERDFLLNPRGGTVGLFGKFTPVRKLPVDRRPIIYHPRSRY